MSKMREISPDGRDALERLCKDLFDDDLELTPVTQIKQNQEAPFSRMDSVLSVVIKQRIDAKAVPISMRKRMLYERSLAS